MGKRAAELRQQSLGMMDRAVAVSGTERLVLLAEALKLHALAREAEAGVYPEIASAISPVVPGASEDEEPSPPSPASP